MLFLNYFYFLVLFLFTGFNLVFSDINDLALYRNKRQTRRTCSNNQFRCRNGQCISPNFACNGIKNCIDGSDEVWEVCEKRYPSSCILPIQSAERNIVLNCDSSNAIRIFQSSRGDFVEELTLLAFSCISETEPKGRQVQSVCLRGKWTPQYSDCLRSCPIVNNPQNAIIKCYQNSQEVNCQQKLPPGTVVQADCRKQYVPNVEAMICEKNAQWNVEQIECIACGLITPGETPFQFPWTVAIFVKQVLVLICAGTIVSPSVIVTAASCFLGTQGTNPDNYILVVGKKKRTFNEDKADFQRPYAIKKIILHPNFDKTYFTNDIAVIQLSEKISYNTAIYPACIDWNESSYPVLKDDEIGEVKNFIISEEKAAIEPEAYIDSEIERLVRANLKLQYMSNNKCKFTSPAPVQDRITEEKFCARYINNQPFTLIDKGTGFFIKRSDNTYTLRGIASGAFSGFNTYRVFVDTTKFLSWISTFLEPFKRPTYETQQRIGVSEYVEAEDVFSYESLRINCSLGDIRTEFVDGCTIPNKNLYHIDFEVTCTESIFQGYCNRSVENAPVPQYTSLRYKCQNEYATYSKGPYETVCFKGKWIPPIEQCNKICKKLKPENVQLQCMYEGRNINCDDNLIVNTEIIATCLPEYKRNSTNNWTGSIFCREDRKWSAPLLQCVPVCGRPSRTKITPTIHNGVNVSLGEFPWHAAVYEKTTGYTLICGATIVSAHAFISAAHCFYDRVNNIQRNAADYEIAVSKITREHKRDSETTQFYEVEKLIFNNFRGLNLRYQRDIVIIVSKNKIIFNPQVSPICMFEDSNTKISTGAKLDIPGWGIDETLNSAGSPSLKVARLPFIGFDECSRIAPAAVLDYLATEKFCAGFVNSTALDQGDSGGGLVIQNSLNSFYYLVGIVSVKAVNQASLALSTYVIEYLPWIREELDKINSAKS